MSELKIATRDERTAFHPAETIQGVVGWRLDQPPQSIELRLFYYTRGKGTDETVVAQTVPFPDPQQEEARPFSVTLPDSPYSFSGKLISLIWALELIALPSNDCTRLEFVLSPSRQEISLEQTESSTA